MKRVALSSALVLAACGGGNEMPPPEHTHDAVTEIRFAAKVGAQDFACGSTYTLGTTATKYKPRDLRFYVSNVVLIDEDGLEVPFTLSANDFQGEGVALIDFEDSSGECANGTTALNTKLVGTAPGGHYKSVAFTLGLPFELNHKDATAAAKPLNSSAMFWSWAMGYKFLKLEGVTTGLPMGHNVHLGSTGCTAGTDPNSITGCSAENRPRITLGDFAAKTSTIVFDAQKLLEGSNLDVNQAGAPGCMSGATDTDCPPIFERLGVPFGGAAATTQTTFSITN